MRGLINLLFIVGFFYGVYWLMNEYHEPDGALGHQQLRRYLVYMQEAERKNDVEDYERLVRESEVYLLRCWRTGDSIGDLLLGEPRGLAWKKHPDCREITTRWFNSRHDQPLAGKGIVF